ncbi:MAG: hypothetical protein LBH48_02495, partial [Bifidobacteriaceae bacterium]|nr:hypothetical protein [Bifidobacteriaceae bacterium]
MSRAPAAAPTLTMRVIAAVAAAVLGVMGCAGTKAAASGLEWPAPGGPGDGSAIADGSVPNGAAPRDGLGLVAAADTRRVGEPPRPGDVVTFTFRLINRGNETIHDIRMTTPGRPAPPITGWRDTPGTLRPGESVTMASTLRLTAQDIATGHAHASAVADGVRAGATTTDDGVQAVAALDAPIPMVARLAVRGEVDPATVPVQPAAGDEIGIVYNVTNPGNVPLAGVRLLDPTGIDNGQDPALRVLRPGESGLVRVPHMINQKEIDRGCLVGFGRARAEALGGDPTDSADDVTASAAWTAPLPTLDTLRWSEPSIELPEGIPEPGDEISVHLSLTNIGNTTLDDLAVSGPPTAAGPTFGRPTKPREHSVTWPGGPRNGRSDRGESESSEDSRAEDPDGDEADLGAAGRSAAGRRDSEKEPPGRLRPGESVRVSLRYALTQQHIDAGELAYVLSAQAMRTKAAPDDWTAEAVDEVRVSTPVRQTHSLNLVRIGPDLPAGQGAGGIATDVFVVANNGNTTLSDVWVADPPRVAVPLFDAWPGPVGRLAPGQTVNATLAYRVTQSDIDTGRLERTAYASAERPSGHPTDPVDDVTATLGTAMPLGSRSELTLTRTADLSGIGGMVGSRAGGAAAGQTIEIRYEVTNTGETTLDDVAVTDPLLTSPAQFTSWPGADRVLLPGQSVTGRGSHVLTEAEIGSGEVVGIGRADGEGPGGDIANPADNIEVKVSDPISLWPGTRASGPPASGEPGQAQLPGQGEGVGPPGSGGEAGGPGSQAGAGTGGSGVARGSPGLALVKTVAAAGLTGGRAKAPKVGDLISFRYTAINTGTVALSGLRLTDPALASPAQFANWPDPSSPGVLAPGQRVEALGVIRLAGEHLDAGVLAGRAWVRADAPGGTPGDGVDDITAAARAETALKMQPELDTDVQASTSWLPDEPQPGGTIVHRVRIRNTGNVTLDSLSINGDGAAPRQVIGVRWPDSAAPGQLAAGQTAAV